MMLLNSVFEAPSREESHSMLDILRKRKRSWVIIFFIVIIVLVFTLWGVGSYLNDPKLENVATINGEALSPREFEAHYQRFVENYRSLFRGALTEEAIRNLNLKGAVLEELVQRRLLLQEARRLELVVTDEELRDSIARIPVFQLDGHFSKTRYLQALRSNRMSPGQFETEQREQITLQRLYAILQDSIQVSEMEMRDRYSLQQEKLNLHFIRFGAKNFLADVKVTPAEIQNLYERNRESFREPLRVQVEYLTYPFEHFLAKVQVSEKELEEYYKANRDTKFHQPKAVHLRHILFQIPQAAGAEQKEKIRHKAQSVLREARAGKDFAQLAREYSEEATAAQGGDVGWVIQGQMLPVLDKAAFGLKKGEVGDVVESPLGFHILKAEETREEKTKSLKDATPEIIQMIKGERGKTEAGKAVDEDRSKTLSGAALSDLAKGRGIPFAVSSWFSRSEVVAEVGPVEAFNKTAFSLAAKELGPVVEGPKAYYLIRGKGRKESSIPPLEALRSEIEKRLKESKAFDLAVQKANKFSAELKKEKDIKQLARQESLPLEETGWFVRSVPEVPKIGALREVRPAALPVSRYQPIAERVYTQGSTAYVLALKESQEADMALFAKEEPRLREELLAEKRQRILEKFLDSLKANAQIKIRPEYLESK